MLLLICGPSHPYTKGCGKRLAALRINNAGLIVKERQPHKESECKKASREKPTDGVGDDLLFTCHFCGCTPEDGSRACRTEKHEWAGAVVMLKFCARCKTVRFCGNFCLRMAWKEHKRECTAPK